MHKEQVTTKNAPSTLESLKKEDHYNLPNILYQDYVWMNYNTYSDLSKNKETSNGWLLDLDIIPPFSMNISEENISASYNENSMMVPKHVSGW